MKKKRKRIGDVAENSEAPRDTIWRKDLLLFALGADPSVNNKGFGPEIRIIIRVCSTVSEGDRMTLLVEAWVL